MKMPYEKPMMAIEYYELTQAIASCSLKISFTSSECVLTDTDSTKDMIEFAYDGYFIGTGCDQEATGMTGSDGICYHTNMNAAFVS